MRLARNLVLSCEILAAHSRRTLLSVTGVVVGVAAVILMVAAGLGAERRILDRIRQMGTNLLVVQAGQTSLVAGRQRQVSLVRTLLPSDAQAIAKECPSVAQVSPATARKMKVHWEGETAITSVVGMAPEGLGIRRYHVARGREFDADENRASRRVALLGPTAARNLCGDADPVGQQIRLGGVPFEVIGALAPKGADPMGADQDDLIIVPIETAMHRLLNVTYVQAIYVQAAGADQMDRAQEEIADLLHQRHRLGGKGDDFTIQNQVAALETQRQASRSLTLLTGAVAGISLTVGGVGILAVMLISVRERTHEIGLRLAVGARRRDIRTQFLLESGLLAGFGGVAGVVLGVAAAMAVSHLGYWDAIISWPAVAVGFLFSMTVGLLFGLYPAMRAARLQPAEALRAEL